ncbi:MAG: hypothetical protein MK193_13175 [Lentisphaeria bacterium]|nr:hypothetical protein [Lentisphaeria bacterium]
MEFFGHDEVKLDSSGRIKLSQSLHGDFESYSHEALVLFCLPEGALGLYPLETWEGMRTKAVSSLEDISSNIVLRRQLRRFGALSQKVTLSRQGRINIPSTFRHYANLEVGTVVLTGVEIGAEIWSPKRWQSELALIQGHLAKKSESEMILDEQIQPLD